jgi:anti-anti-sigma factor
MEIAINKENGRVPITVFAITGEISATTYKNLENEARKSFDAGTRDLILDFSEVSYISSAGLRALHSIHNLLRTSSTAESDEAVSKGLQSGTFKSPHLKIVNPTKNVLEILRTAGYDQLFEIHPTTKDAVRSF